MCRYLLWERHGAQLRLAQWDWLRMKCTTLQYIHSLKVLCDNLREIITILGPIRVDSDEGANGLKVGNSFFFDKLLDIFLFIRPA